MNEPASFSTGFGSDVPEGEIKSEIAKIEGSEEGWEAVGEEKPKKKSLFDAPPYPVSPFNPLCRELTGARSTARGEISTSVPSLRHVSKPTARGRTTLTTCMAMSEFAVLVNELAKLCRENIATRKVLLEQNPGKRPFILSRSTFAGQGAQSAHWYVACWDNAESRLGDNYSTFASMRASVQGVLQFQMFQVRRVRLDSFVADGS